MFRPFVFFQLHFSDNKVVSELCILVGWLLVVSRSRIHFVLHPLVWHVALDLGRANNVEVASCMPDDHKSAIEMLQLLHVYLVKLVIHILGMV